MILPGMPRPVPMKLGGGGLPAGTTWNPLDKHSSLTLSNGDLTVTNTGFGNRGVRATSVVSGKVYWEIVIGSVATSYIGIGTAAASLSNYLGADANGWSWQQAGAVRNSNSIIQTIAAYSAGDILGFAVDIANLKLHFSKNGVWQASSNPAAATGGFDIAALDWLPMVAFNNTTDVTANFNGSFVYPVPAGFN